MKKFLLFSLFLTIATYINAQTDKKFDTHTLSVFPNPATEYITLNTNDESVKNIYVFNLAGRKMRTFEVVKGERYEVGDLPNGIYFIQLIGRNNKLLTIQRLTKKS